MAKSESVVIKEIMSDVILLIFDYGIHIDIGHAVEDMGFHQRIGLLQFRDQLLDLQSL